MEYVGDGTFYGAGGAGEHGACMLPSMFNGVSLTVALSPDQFMDGQMCGKCVRITGDGSGLGTQPIIGPYYATVDNLCPECRSGDVDMGMNGDGRWRISWDFVDCEEARQHNTNKQTVTHEAPQDIVPSFHSFKNDSQRIRTRH